MIILGINIGHDACAALIKNGEIIADVQEERFSRIKHCLDHANIKNINEVDFIAFSHNGISSQARVMFGLEIKDNTLLRKVKNKIKGSLGVSKHGIPIYFPDFTITDPSKCKFIEHHLSHAASAYYTQPNYDKCLIFTIDGVGDHISTAAWLGESNSITPLVKYGKEAGIGLAYSIITEGLHWIHGDGEGKTMGLAPYGNYENCKGIINEIFPQFKDEILVKKAIMGEASSWEESGSMQYHMKEANMARELVNKFGKEDVAAEAQRQLEENISNFIFGWCKKTGINKIACAGGVFLNVKMNQRIWNSRNDLIEYQHIYPNPGDSGLAVGAALHVYYQFNKFEGATIDNLYKGPSYCNKEIEELLNVRKLNYQFLENPTIKAAELLSQNKIVAWFQGRMESGPRALGNRSILMSPNRPENKDIINARVKFREGFRPFCPSVLYEKRDVYLKDARDEFFMITSFDMQEDKKNKIPAVVHVDGTGRPQLVSKEKNPLYWELIKRFGDLTGEYAVLNTSFNIMGEPIINNPKEAIRGFFDSGIDAIFINNFFLMK
jgi:carbamoyltransferase